jgi:hypothetical protein
LPAILWFHLLTVCNGKRSVCRWFTYGMLDSHERVHVTHFGSKNIRLRGSKTSISDEVGVQP